MAIRATEPRRKERLDQVQCHSLTDRSTAHTDDIDVIVFDSLSGREMIVDQRSPDTCDLVGAHRRANTAAADRHATFNPPGRDGLSEGYYKIGVVVREVQSIRAEINHIVLSIAEMQYQVLLQTETTVIGCD